MNRSKRHAARALTGAHDNQQMAAIQLGQLAQDAGIVDLGEEEVIDERHEWTPAELAAIRKLLGKAFDAGTITGADVDLLKAAGYRVERKAAGVMIYPPRLLNRRQRRCATRNARQAPAKAKRKRQQGQRKRPCRQRRRRAA